MAESLRELQKRLARETILRATADQAAEVGSFDFSIGDVAKRAGVSHRTVYNYFESRDGLIDALSEWIDTQWTALGGVVIPESLSEVPDATRSNFLVFEEQSHLVEVIARLDPVERVTSAQERRTQAFSRVVADSYPDLTPRQLQSTAVLLRQVASARNWYQMTRGHGLSTSQAAEIAAWAIERIILALDRGEFPPV